MSYISKTGMEKSKNIGVLWACSNCLNALSICLPDRHCVSAFSLCTVRVVLHEVITASLPQTSVL